MDELRVRYDFATDPALEALAMPWTPATWNPWDGPRAVLSDDGVYRYVLGRPTGSICPVHREVVFVMLNPSTADATVDDRTIGRCVDFARRWGYAWLTVVNLFAFRATKPRKLAGVADPVGPDNDAWISACSQRARTVVLAWGAHGLARERGDDVFDRMRWHVRRDLMWLGTTKDGAPRHPLYVPKTTTLEAVTWF